MPGYKVVVLETEAEVEFPGSEQQIHRWDVCVDDELLRHPDDMVIQATEPVVLESPNEHFI